MDENAQGEGRHVLPPSHVVVNKVNAPFSQALPLTALLEYPLASCISSSLLMLLSSF